MSGPEIPGVPRADDRATDRLHRRALPIAWLLLSLLGLVAAWALLDETQTPAEIIQSLLTAGVFVALVVHRRFERIQFARREAREASSGRLLQGLSRSVSPQSVVDAIVQELCLASGADHVVVSRLRRADELLETTVVSAREAVPASTTFLPASILDPDAGVGADGIARLSSRPRRAATTQAGHLPTGALVAAEAVASRVRTDYGLHDTLAAPLVEDGQPIGALVLSHRAGRQWSAASQRLLDWAAEEVSLALGRAHAFEAAEQQANMDALTALPNRRYFDQLTGVLRLGRRAGDSVGVLMIDIDHFKAINDRHGHTAGDRVIRAVADAIAGSIRAEDTPARYGGEEFAVLLKQATPEPAAEVAERVRSAVAGLGEAELGIAGSVSVSVGVAVDGHAIRSLSELVERADAALYAAKRRGRDRVVVA
jgi:diguanylate cyclase (GGDEF)-like protein